MIGKTDEYLAISTQIKLTGFDFSDKDSLDPQRNSLNAAGLYLARALRWAVASVHWEDLPPQR